MAILSSVSDLMVNNFDLNKMTNHKCIPGEGNGQFNAPTGVAVDTQDNILVADWGNSRIQVRKHLLIHIS